jgi:hypothetical protein
MNQSLLALSVAMRTYQAEVERAVRVEHIGWNELTEHQRLLCAEDAGDVDWRLTKNIAEKVVPMGLEMVYHRNVLQYIVYKYPATPCFTGQGYKGRGMLDSEKARIEKHFMEVSGPRFKKWPYVYNGSYLVR